MKNYPKATQLPNKQILSTQTNLTLPLTQLYLTLTLSLKILQQ